MKKMLIATLATGLISSVFADNVVSSANIVGYTKIAKPGNGQLNIMGVSFEGQDLNSIVDPLQFSGHASDYSQADQIIVYDASAQAYETYALYDMRSFGDEYASYTAWKSINDFSYSGEAYNPSLNPGSAVWIKGSGSTTDTNIVMSGDAILADSATIEIVTGLQLVSNPFSDTVALTNLAIQANATGHATSYDLADQVILFNNATQTYETYALYDMSSYGSDYDIYTGWKSISDFSFSAPFADVTLNPGQGFWIKASKDFTWTETNKYLDKL